MSDFWIGIIITTVYLIGWIIFCILNLKRVGTVESNYEGEWNVETIDVVLEGVFWPLTAIVILIFSPVIILTRIFEAVNHDK